MMASHALMQVVQQAVLLNSKQELLILKRPEGVWQFPGGRLEQGERWDEGLRREIREETGIADIKILSVLMVDNFAWQEQQLYSAYFLCRTPTDVVRLSAEHSESRWLCRNDDLSEIEFWHDNLRRLAQQLLTENR